MAIRHDEELISLRDAAKALPPRREGKSAHPITLARWATRGLWGVNLEVLRIGGTVYTTREALQRFFEALTEAERKPSDPKPSQPDGLAS